MVEEPESAGLHAFLTEHSHQVTSAIAEVEVLRAVRRVAPRYTDRAAEVVAQVSVIEVGEAIRARAGLLEPAGVRSLDAVHLATAIEVGDALDAVLTYDERMAEAARSLGLATVAPA